jgi:hypothetical protein
MNTLKKKEGVYYTQMPDDLPIGERVFFREGKGISATSEYYRIATEAEVAEWEKLKKKQEEEHQSMMGYE